MAARSHRQSRLRDFLDSISDGVRSQGLFDASGDHRLFCILRDRVPPTLEAPTSTSHSRYATGKIDVGQHFHLVRLSSLCGGQRFGVGVGESVASMDAMT